MSKVPTTPVAFTRIDGRQRVVFGPGAFDAAHDAIIGLGSRVAVVTGETHARRTGLIDRLVAGLVGGGASVSVLAMRGEPTAGNIDALGAGLRRESPDVLVGVGGGAVLDATKALAGVGIDERPAWSLTFWGRQDPGPAEPVANAIPVVAIPTLSASGSESNGTGVLADDRTGDKAVFADPAVLPVVAVIDPKLTIDVGPTQTWAGAMDLLSHGLERLLTVERATPEQRRRASELVDEVVAAAATTTARRSLHARSYLALKAGEVWEWAEDEDTPWTLHAIAHVLGPAVHLGHAACMSYLLPAWASMIATLEPERLSRELAWPAHVGRPRPHPADLDAVATRVMEIHAIDDRLPGWPDVRRDTVARFLRFALTGRPAEIDSR